jgi:Tfp pilus assembly protein PilX
MRGLRLVDERGWAVVTATMVMSLIAAIGLATYSFVDVQARESGKERTRESSFYLADAALQQQAFLLSRNWPSSSTAAYPAACTAATGGVQCPAATGAWKGTFDTADYAGSTWRTTVHDDDTAAPNFFNDATASGNRYDANGNGIMWVRAESTLKGKSRIVVAQVKQGTRDLAPLFPHNVITAGAFSTSNNGNKVIVDAKGNAQQASSLAVRCTNSNSPSCLDYRSGQVSPPGSIVTGYSGGNALPPDAIDSLKTAAKAGGTYYAGCPASLSGPVVYIVSGGCNYTGNTQFNSLSQPGVVVVENGTLALGGTTDFYGVVYMVNSSNSAGVLFRTHGNAVLTGGVAVDGVGAVDSGSSKLNILYDPNAFNALVGAGQAGIVQNSWREMLGN